MAKARTSAAKTRYQAQAARRSEPNPGNLTYYIVLLVAGLTGFMAYSSGASLEGALLRSVVVLLACTLLGYAANVVLAMAVRTPAGAAAEPQLGRRVDRVAGDDDDQLRAATASARS